MIGVTRDASAAGEAPREDLTVAETIDVSLGQIYVVVTRHGQRALSLTRNDFELRRGAAPVPILTFERGDVPFTAEIVVDLSGSMRGAPLAMVRRGVASLARGLGPDDEAQVMLFGGRVEEVGKLTSGAEQLVEPFEPRHETAFGSAVYDAVFWAARALRARLGRRVVVLLSDGVDLHSALTPQQLAEELVPAEILLYWIRPRSPVAVEVGARGEARHDELSREMERLPPAGSWRTQREAASRLTDFEALVEQTGGRVLSIETTAEVEGALQEILRELRDQYVLGYAALPSESTTPRVVMTRRGYRIQSSSGASAER